MEIVILDSHTTDQGVLSWKALEAYGNLFVFPRSTRKEALHRIKDAEIVVTNKMLVDETFLRAAPKLKFVSLLATGYNNVSSDGVRVRNIPVSNVPAYSTDGVAQHVFSMILAFINRVVDHHRSVQAGKWQDSADFSYTLSPIRELNGKTLGIYGFGRIGRKVAEIGQGFGMNVIAHHRHPKRDARPGVKFVDSDELLRNSDFLSLHAPLNDASQGFIRASSLAKMKSTALLINTARGGLIIESDLRNALVEGILAGAALDVLSEEPPRNGNILIGAPNCIITPHIAWQSVESRQRLIETTEQNIGSFIRGEINNRVL